MQTYANQKVVIINKCQSNDKRYVSFSQEIGQKACANIKRVGALKLWLYLSKNCDEYKFALSPKDCEKWGISKDAYHAGVSELIAKGYLITSGINQFIFHDMPTETTIPDENNPADEVIKEKGSLPEEEIANMSDEDDDRLPWENE